MKRVKCPQCSNYITFDETRYADGQQLIFECPECKKQFSIRIGKSHLHASENFRANEGSRLRSAECSRKGPRDKKDEEETSGEYGCIVVIENVFHHKQVIHLQMGDNVIGRYVKGTSINTPIETVDPSVDTKHCIIRVQHNRQGELQYILRDAPSNTGTFYQNEILRDTDRIRLEDGSVITIGATSIILHLQGHV